MMAMLVTLASTAIDNNGLKYTKENPLVYEDLWDLPPFSFINDEGKPDGFNIALVQEMLKRLDVPYVIKLKHTPLNFQDVSTGEAALTIGMKAPYHDKYGAYSKSTVMLFTHSIASPKNNPTEIRSFDDLKDNKVYVHRNSFSHNQMIDAGLSANAIPADDIKAILMQVAANDSGMVLWNTNTLKDLVARNRLDNIKITTVSMKYGEYHFMSRDTLLLQKLDSIYNQMEANDEILPLRKMWFYPEMANNNSFSLAWYVAFALGLFILILIAYNIYYKVQERRMKEMNERQSKRLGLLLRSGKIDVWTYNTTNKMFTLFSSGGKDKETYNQKAFALLFPDADFKCILEEIENMKVGLYDKTKLLVKCNLNRDSEGEQMAYYDLNISVLQSGDDDLPVSLIGIMHNVTAEKKKFIDTRNNLLKYRTIFNTSMADLAYYDKDGILTDINQNACMTFGIKDRETLIKSRTHISEIPVFMDLKGDVCREMWMSSITDMDKLHMQKESTKYWTRTGMIYYEFTIMPIYNSNGEPICFVSCGKDVTETAKRMNKERMRQRRIENTNEQIKSYTNDINYALEVSGTRLANYYPDSHEMSIAYDIKKPMLRLSQLRCVSLLEREYKSKAEKLFLNLDKKRLKKFELRVGTIFKDLRKDYAHYEFNGIPIRKNGAIDHYFCLCRNVSKLVETEKQLEEETKRAQEAEEFQNSFLKNMSHEIRTPLNAIVGFSQLLLNPDMEFGKEEREDFGQIIRTNSELLTTLVGDIISISELESGRYSTHLQKESVNTICKNSLQTVIHRTKQNVAMVFDKQLDDDFSITTDAQRVCQVLINFLTNAIKYTEKGSITISAKADEDTKTVTFSVTDTGIGIPLDKQKDIFERFMKLDDFHQGTGLGLNICHLIAEKLGGEVGIDPTYTAGSRFLLKLKN